MRLTSKNKLSNASEVIRSESGVVFVEYVALITLVTIVGLVAVLGLGVPLLRLYRYGQMILSLPIP